MNTARGNSIEMRKVLIMVNKLWRLKCFVWFGYNSDPIFSSLRSVSFCFSWWDWQTKAFLFKSIHFWKFLYFPKNVKMLKYFIWIKFLIFNIAGNVLLIWIVGSYQIWVWQKCIKVNWKQGLIFLAVFGRSCRLSKVITIQMV